MTHLRNCFSIFLAIVFLQNCFGNELDEATYNLLSDQIISHLNKVNGGNSLYNYETSNLKIAQHQDNNAVVEAIVTSRCKSADLCPAPNNLHCKTVFNNPNINTYTLNEEKIDCHYVSSTDDYRSHCANCPSDLNVNAEGISTFVNTALKHLNSEGQLYVLGQVLRVQRQVLETVPYGVKYFLDLQVIKDGIPETCQIVFLEKPVLENTRNVISNNCTESQAFTTVLPEESLEHRNDQNNEIDVNFSLSKPDSSEEQPVKSLPNFEEIAQTGNADDAIKITDPGYEGMSPSRIQEIESQIIPNVNKKVYTNLGSEKRKAIDGLVDLFDFDIEPPVKTINQFRNEAGELLPAEEPIIVPVRAVVSYQQPETHQAKIETVIIGVTSTDEIENVTEDSRQKRDISHQKELQPTTRDEQTLIENLSEIAVNTLDNIDTDNHKRVVLNIVDAKKSQFKGLIYHLVLEVGISECMEDQVENLAKCKRKIIPSLTMSCKVQVLVNADKANPKVIKSQCQKRNGEHNNRTGGRTRREIAVGAPIQFDTNSPQFVKIMDAALTKLDSTSGEPNRLKVTRVIEATSQVVAGVLYKFKVELGLSNLDKSDEVAYEGRQGAGLMTDPKTRICTISALQQAWISNSSEITVNCDDKVTAKFRAKRQTMPGGEFELDPNTPKFEELLQHSLNQLDTLSGEPNRFAHIAIIKTSQQVVAGSLYTITAKVGLTDLPNGKAASLSERKSAKLPQNPNFSKIRVCTFKIWEQLWMKANPRTIDVDCRPVSFDTNSPKFEELFHSALNQLETETNSTNRYAAITIDESKEKIIKDGIEYVIPSEVRLTELVSTNPTYKDRRNSKLLPNTKTKKCVFTITEKLNKPREITIDCAKSIRKRAVDADKLFQSFVTKYNKTYVSTREWKKRSEIFKDNMKIWDEFNLKEQGTAKYGPTIFADLTKKEFKQYLGYNPGLRNENDIPMPMANIPDIQLPDSFDWRTKGAVTEVKNQGMCGSCWAFSVTGNVEGLYAIKNEKLLEFSEQELVDCDTLDDGCSGGLMDNAYRSLEKLGGLETESAYPYDGKNEKCQFQKSKAMVQIKSGLNITQDEVGMAKWLVANGPISIAINANAMQFYMGGVSHPWKALCNPSQLDHGVLIVGYGVSNNKYFNKQSPYWIVKNSWGHRWGEQGYYRVYRGAGTCGLNQTPSSAVLAD